MPVKLTHLRRNLYQIIDRLLETGESLEIERNGKRLILSPQLQPNSSSLWERLESRPGYMKDEADSFIHSEWIHEWNPEGSG